MTTFTDVFTGAPVYPTNVIFREVTVVGTMTLVWPVETTATDNICPRFLYITAASATPIVRLPSAKIGGVGADVLIFNASATNVTVQGMTGTVLGVVPGGQLFLFTVRNDLTDAGFWLAFQFGASTYSASAASLAGSGLITIASLLNANLTVVASAGAVGILPADRAAIRRHTGGAVAYTLPNPATLTNGFFFVLVNNGSGTVTLTPSIGTINGLATQDIFPNGGVLVITDGTNWFTLGSTGIAAGSYTTGAIDLTGLTALSLNSAQRALSLQVYTGAPAGAVTVDYGTVVGDWDIRNDVTGGFNVTVRVGGGDPGVVIPAGSTSSVTSDGVNIRIRQTTGVGSVTSITTSDGVQGGPITSTGNISLTNTAVTPGTYGDINQIPIVTIDSKGRITSASETAITFPTNYLLYCGTAGGSAGTLTLTPSPSLTSLYAGLTLLFVNIASASPGATTLNPSALGAKSVLRADGTALVPGDLPANAVIAAEYDGTNFRLVASPTSDCIDTQALPYTLLPSDAGKVIIFSGSGTLTLPAAANYAGFQTGQLINGGTGLMTIDPNGTELVDGRLTLPIPPGFSGRLIGTGSAWRTTFPSEIDVDSRTLTGTATEVVFNNLSPDLDYTFTLMVRCDSAPTVLRMQTSNDNGGSYATGGSDYAWSLIYDPGSGPNATAIRTGDSSILLTVTGQLNQWVPATIIFFTGSASSRATLTSTGGVIESATGGFMNYSVSGQRLANGLVNAIKFYMTVNNVDVGSILTLRAKRR